MHAGACPKVLLAFMPEHDRRDGARPRADPRSPRIPQSIPMDLERELEDIRTNGYGIGDQDLDLGAAAVAAPIRDFSGQVVGAISVAGPLSRVESCLRTELRRQVVNAAEQVSLDLATTAQKGGSSTL